MRLRSLTLAAGLAILLVAFFAAGAAAQGRITGMVNDDSNKPIKGATVTAENPEIGQRLNTTTDDQGRFVMIGLRSGPWRFEVQAPGYFGDAGSMLVRSGGPNPPLVFALKKPAGPRGALAGITAKDLQDDLAAADALLTLGKWDEAVSAYRAIMTKAPMLSAINLQIATAYMNKKDYDAAIAAYTDLLKTSPNNEKATIGLAKANIEKGDRATAESVLIKAAERPAAGRDVFYTLGEILFDKGDTDGAMKWYQKAADTDPAWSKPWYKLGLAAQKKGDKAAAAGFLNKVLTLDPTSPEAPLAKSALDELNR